MEVAEEGIRHYAAQQHQWPLDWAGSRSPSLMLGLSGVGYFYLRLQDPEVPSVLWPEREAIMRRIGGHA
jgi:lantibiotic modifying enzyme